ncbi:hypothetical protein CBL20_24900, partial [Shigella flexneri]
IDASLFQTQALVLCPTRELADQVAGELRRLARFLPNTKILTLCGGQPFGMQRDSLQHAPHIIVATPGAGRRASGDPCRKRCSRAGENRQRQNGGFWPRLVTAN